MTLEELKESYLNSSDPELKEKIKRAALHLKAGNPLCTLCSIGCASITGGYCDDCKQVEFGEGKSKKRVVTIEFMQEKLREWAIEAREKRLANTYTY